MTQLASPRRAVLQQVSRQTTPMVIGSVMAVTLLAKLVSTFVDRKLHPAEHSMRNIERAVIGYNAGRVLTRLGSPSAVTHSPANVWYYRLNSRDRRVMAVTFDRGHAARVELIQSPA